MKAFQFFLMLTISSAALPAIAQTSSSLCAGEETTYFSCQAGKAKQILSLCGTPKKTLQYRYGTRSNAELTYPIDPANGWAQMAIAHYSRYQTEREELSFSVNGVSYTVFDYTEHGQRDAGIQVTLRDGHEQERRCQGKVTGSLSTLINIVPCDKDSALSSGSCN